MTPSKRIDRVFAGIGRVAITSGTDHSPTFKRINAMLTGLYKTGQLDVIAAIRDGKHAPLVVLRYYERGQMSQLPSAETSLSLIPAFRSFVASHPVGKAQRANMETTTRHLERTNKKASVSELPALLRLLKQEMADRPAAFNKVRSHALTFASEIQGEMSPLWLDVMRVKRFKASTIAPKVIHRRPLTVAELDAVCAAFTDTPVYGGRRGGGRTLRRTITAASLTAMTRTLAMTGMRPKEYWQREHSSWTDHTTHVWVDGTKTSNAKRPTFRYAEPVLPSCGEQFFRRAFTAATESALREALDVYSLRRTFSAFCESAQVEASRRDAYMGHGPQTVPELYLKTKVLPFVAADAAKVSAYLTAERARAAAPTLKLEKGS